MIKNNYYPDSYILYLSFFPFSFIQDYNIKSCIGNYYRSYINKDGICNWKINSGSCIVEKV
jgi:hypothetical protein